MVGGFTAMRAVLLGLSALAWTASSRRKLMPAMQLSRSQEARAAQGGGASGEEGGAAALAPTVGATQATTAEQSSLVVWGFAAAVLVACVGSCAVAYYRASTSTEQLELDQANATAEKERQASGGSSAPSRTVTLRTMQDRDSFLFPEGNAPDVPPPESRQGGVLVEMLLFTFFVASRAFHPAFIDNAKEKLPGQDKATLQYAKIMPVVLECIVTLILGQLMALYLGGVEQWKTIWRWAPLKVFGGIGIVYAWGDILEVLATSAVSGDAYQVLLQSKLLVTAVMMKYVKGTQTSNLQWTILAVVMCAMSVYSIAGKPPAKPKPIDPKYYNMTMGEYVAMEAANPVVEDSSVDMEYVIGIGMVVLKVVVSCFCAVLSDKYMKDWQSQPIYIQLVQFKVTWLPMVVVYSFFDGETWVKGPLNGFGGKASLVLASFTVKFWLTMYLLAILDSVLKNIGEASSVLVTFFLSIYVFNKSEFEMAAFLMVLSVTLSVIAYIQSKPVVEKAKKYDEALSQ